MDKLIKYLKMIVLLVLDNRPKFNSLKEEILGLVGLMEALEIAPSKPLEAEFRRFSNRVTNVLPSCRKESIEVCRMISEPTT